MPPCHCAAAVLPLSLLALVSAEVPMPNYFRPHLDQYYSSSLILTQKWQLSQQLYQPDYIPQGYWSG